MNYNWRQANGTDVLPITQIAIDYFQKEIDNIFVPNPNAYNRNITLAIVNQFYNPLSEFFSVATDSNNNIIAYTWAKPKEYTPWSDEEILFVKMAHVNLDLPAKTRVKLINDMLRMWETFATLAKISIICSSTMRRDQQAFLKLHEKHNYDIRGSYAYKKLSA